MTESAPNSKPCSTIRFNDILTRNDSSVSRRPVTAPSFMSRDAVGKPLIFFSDYKNMVLDIYTQARPNKMVGQITGFGNTYPGGLATDTARNLYVTNGENVVVYAPPYTGPPTLTLSDNGYFSNAGQRCRDLESWPSRTLVMRRTVALAPGASSSMPRILVRHARPSPYQTVLWVSMHSTPRETFTWME